MPDDTKMPEHVSEPVAVWLRKPAHLLTDEEAAAFDRGLKLEARRDRLMSSPILDSLGEDDGVPDEVRILRDQCVPTLALRAVQKWVGMWTGPAAPVTRPVLILAGPTGVGKTMAAGWCVSEVGARYVRFPELIQDHRAFARREGMDDMERQRATFRRKYGGQMFVILDEVGIEKESEREDAREALHYFFEIRQKWSQRTLVLTNKSNAELVERFRTDVYDKRTLDRLKRLLVTTEHDPDLLAVDLKGESMRRAHKKG